jgi:hypothetical protein
MSKTPRTFIEDLAEGNAVGNWYRPAGGGPDYFVLEVNEEENSMLVDIGGTERSRVLSRSLRNPRLKYDKNVGRLEKFISRKV